MRPEAQGWWQQANEDVATSRANIESGRFYAAAFFSQQALEKAFKAVWIEKFRELPPKTHDLTELAEKLETPGDFGTTLRDINPAYATARYPDAANGLPARAFNEEIAPPTRRRRKGDGVVPKRARPQLEPFVYDFARRLREEVDARRVILFGSRARGDSIKESDYDFIVVSPRFQGMPFATRPVELYELWEGSPGVELLCYTPEEFERKVRQISVVAEAAKEGVEL